MFINHELAKKAKRDFPPDTRIELISMDDPHAPIEKGTKGSVNYVDDAGQIHMKWDNGRTIAVNLELDEIKIIDAPPVKEPLPVHHEILVDHIEISINESDLVKAFEEIGVPPSLDNIDIASEKNLMGILEPRINSFVAHELKLILAEFEAQNLFKGEVSND